MMKRLYCVLLFVAAFLMTACYGSFQDNAIEGNIAVSVSVVDGAVSKSSFSKPDDEVGEVALALYSGGLLYKSSYWTSVSGLSISDVVLGSEYHVYVLANAGRVAFPASEADVPAMKLNWSDVKDAARWPMSYSDTFTASRGGVINVKLVRLVARCDLKIDKSSLSLYTFTVKSAGLKCGAGDCRPFIERSVPTINSVNPDSATNADVSALNSGTATTYYLFESCFGDLLPDNHDAWNKVPSNLPSDVDPPYFEITGELRFTDNSLNRRNVTYRFYLGKNATRNFDVVRNTVNEVTLVLNDSNVDRGSWKVEAGDFDEQASMSFNPQTRSIPYLTSAEVSLNVNPYNLLFKIYEKDGSMTDAGLSFSVNGKRVTITSTRPEITTGTLYASTIDGRMECSCTITTEEPPVTLKSIRLRCIYGEYDENERVYYQTSNRWFSFEADLVYSDGHVEENIPDFSILEWVILDDAVVSEFPGNPEKLNAIGCGETTVYVKKGSAVSNPIRVHVYDANLSVHASPSSILSNGQCVLLAYYGKQDVSRFTDWSITSGDEYGEIVGSDLTYRSFVPDEGLGSSVDVTIEGFYNGYYASCIVHVDPAGSTSGPTVTHRLSLTPASASIDYNGSCSFKAIYYTITDGVSNGGVDVTTNSLWSVDDVSAAVMSGQGKVTGANTSSSTVSTKVNAMYSGLRSSASLNVGPAPVNPVPPDPDPDPDPVVEPTGIRLTLDKASVWYGEYVDVQVTALFSDGSTQDVSNKVTSWPTVEGCTRNGSRYTHAYQGLVSDVTRNVTITYGGFSATASFMLCKRYVADINALFAEVLSSAGVSEDKPNYEMVFNDGGVKTGRPGDIDHFTVDGGHPMDGGMEIGVKDFSKGSHLLTIYVYVPGKNGALELKSDSRMFTIGD